MRNLLCLTKVSAKQKTKRPENRMNIICVQRYKYYFCKGLAIVVLTPQSRGKNNQIMRSLKRTKILM